MRRRHQPIPEQGRWLASVLRGHSNYYAVPDNIEALRAFRYYAIEHWYRALRRRSQRDRLTWERMRRLATDGYRPRGSCIPGQTRALTLVPKGGAQCASSARWDLCGGRVEPSAKPVPTAINWSVAKGTSQAPVSAMSRAQAGAAGTTASLIASGAELASGLATRRA